MHSIDAHTTFNEITSRPEASLEYINSAGWFLIICLGFVILALIVVIITGLVKDEAEFDPTLPVAGIVLTVVALVLTGVFVSVDHTRNRDLEQLAETKVQEKYDVLESQINDTDSAWYDHAISDGLEPVTVTVLIAPYERYTYELSIDPEQNDVTLHNPGQGEAPEPDGLLR
jgi:glucan phosphoethanolaminetransferase (alkaline phosphatase superfamily)